MSLLMETTRRALVLAISLPLLFVSGCTDTMVVVESVPVRILGENNGEIVRPNSYWTTIPGGRMHVNSFNALTVSSQARVAGIEVEGSYLGHYTLGSSPFVIEVSFDLDSGSGLLPNNPFVRLEGKVIEGRVLKPVSSRSCVDQIDNNFEEVNLGELIGDQGSMPFCIRYEFPIDPIDPNSTFSANFGTVKTINKSYDLELLFKPEQKAIRASR